MSNRWKAAGQPVDAGLHPGVHHVGVWVDDVVVEAERLVDAGWAIAAAHLPPEEGFGCSPMSSRR